MTVITAAKIGDYDKDGFSNWIPGGYRLVLTSEEVKYLKKNRSYYIVPKGYFELNWSEFRNDVNGVFKQTAKLCDGLICPHFSEMETIFLSDLDGDCLSDTMECGASGQNSDYDGNQDHHPDKDQAHVASFLTSNMQDYLTIASNQNTKLFDVKATEIPTESPKRANFPLGFFEFSIKDVGIGGATTVILYPPPGISKFSTYYKYGPEKGTPQPHWYTFNYDEETKTGAELNPKDNSSIVQPDGTIILHFKDGVRGDDDVLENGIIIDAGGPSFFVPLNVYLPIILK